MLGLTPAHTQHVIQSFQNLDELHLDECWGITSNVVNIGEAKTHGTSKHFFHCCTSVTRLCILSVEGEHESIGSLITDKFPKLESLELEICLNHNSMALIEQPRLKFEHEEDDTVMRKLSESGIIEKLIISDSYNFEMI